MINWFLLVPMMMVSAGGREPSASEVLRESLEPPQAPYAAQITFTRFSAGKPDSRRLSVRFSPPGLFRRELLGPSGEIRQLAIEDGKTEWIYDAQKKKVWQGAVADPLFKRFGPEEELDHLLENYEASLSTAGSVAGRACWRLELRSRSDNSLARRLWIDRSGFLVLRSENFLPDGSLADSTLFTRLQLGAASDPGLFRFSPPPGVVALKRAEPDYLALDEAKSAGIEPHLPAWLPAGYVFESLDIIPKGRRAWVHYRFSDGLNVLSLFQCPPRSRLNFGGRQKRRVKLSHAKGYLTQTPEGNVLSWNSGGWRFVLVGPVSEAALERAAESVKGTGARPPLTRRSRSRGFFCATCIPWSGPKRRWGAAARRR